MLLLMLFALGAIPPTPPLAHIDHVLLGVRDLDAGVREFEMLTGVKPVYGGKHPDRGTHNALVSLGPETYLEIIAPQPGVKMNEDLASFNFEHLTPVGFAIAATDAETVRKQLARGDVKTTALRAGSRVTPKGATLRWQTFGVDDSAEAPFFIHWEDLSVHPAKTSPGGCTLARFEVPSGKDQINDRIRKAFGLNYETSSGDRPRMTLALRCGDKTVEFPQKQSRP
jgi:hypothetical protein